MKEAMWRVDPDGEYRFSDATNPDQAVLFESNVTPILIDQLRAQFKGRGAITCLELRRFVENKTPFLKKHMTSALRQEEACARIAVDTIKIDGKIRRANTYPDEARLRIVDK